MVELSAFDDRLLSEPTPALALHLHEKIVGAMAGRAFAPRPLTIRCELPVRTALPAHDAVALLEREHRDGHIYRGQTKRHVGVWRGVVRDMQRWLSAGEESGNIDFAIEVDSLLPSRFRGGVSVSGPSLHHVAGAFRAICRSNHHGLRELVADHLRLRDTTPLTLQFLAAANAVPNLAAGIPFDHEAPNASRELATLIAVAQHYGFKSTMVDFTHSPIVATWFATHEWSGRPKTSGEGVIYRLDRQRMTDALKEVALGTVAYRDRILSTILGIADLKPHGERYGLRPARQEGLSAFGFESAVTYLFAEIERALEIFPVVLTDDSERATPIAGSFLRPPASEDVFAAAFDGEQNPESEEALTFSEIVAFMDALGFTSEAQRRVELANMYGLI